MRAPIETGAGLRELPRSLLAGVSYGFHESMSGLVKRVIARRTRRLHASSPVRWRPFSENFEKKGFLPMISVIGPRWNCHAAVAQLGLVEVKRELTCCTQALLGHAQSWSIVLYDEAMRTVNWTGSTSAGAEPVTWSLAPGLYGLGMRAYGARDALIVPNVILDGRDLQVGRRIDGEGARYDELLESIRGKDGLYYRLLHYYIFRELSRSQPRREAWVRRHFLPVGNPETDWRYGHLARGERLKVQCNDAHRARVNTYVSFYNRASFPVFWCQVRDGAWLSPRFDEPVAYALRAVATGPALDAARLDCERVSSASSA